MAAIALLCVTAPAMARAQTGAFVATLGADTVHVERYERKGRDIEGVVVTRVPSTTISTYRLSVDGTGRLVRYEVRTTMPDGSPVLTDGATGTMTMVGDTLVRETLTSGQMTTGRMFAPNGAFPTPAIPYIGVTYLAYELAFDAARRRGGVAPDSMAYFLTMFARQSAPTARRIWFPASDSVELDYFRVARSGYRFDRDGRLLRADWSGMTYRYRISSARDLDVLALAKAWGAADARGSGVGALSPRDTSRGDVGGIAMSVEYSRPAARGRTIWGDVVKPNVVWRLGADMATHTSIGGDLQLGGVTIPAGRYTLWMVLQGDGQAQLVVNKRVNVFGTQYDPSADLVRIPLKRMEAPNHAERLTIAIRATSLDIAWGSVVWTAPVSRP